MRLLYISTFLFHKENGTTYGLPANSVPFFEKYLDVFKSVKVLGEELSSHLDKNSLAPMLDSRIDVRIIPSNTHHSDFSNDVKIKKILIEEISQDEAIIIKPSTRKGMMAIRIAKKLAKPYMIEMTGDIHNALKQHPNLLKRLYAPILYHQIRNSIKDAPFGLYVSKEYLQSQFPIKGECCGCSDVILDFSDKDVLRRRFNLIETIDSGRVINLALIGFYQGKMKGVDTAIRALSRLPHNFHLNILGNGTLKNRKKWFDYALSLGIMDAEERITFPKPLQSYTQVLKWLDTQDFFVFPTLSEGFGRCVAEAMSRGCVCFATNICTMPELLPKESLFPKHEDKALASLILKYSKDKQSMKTIAEINYRHSQDYAPEILREHRNNFLIKFKEYIEKIQH